MTGQQGGAPAPPAGADMRWLHECGRRIDSPPHMALAGATECGDPGAHHSYVQSTPAGLDQARVLYDQARRQWQQAVTAQEAAWTRVTEAATALAEASRTQSIASESGR